jgi:NADP-dependent 3-hydroxy acid dehydrogenase YdfG
MTDRVAIATGAGRGLGRAMALGLAAAGARVVVTAARVRDEIEDTASEGRAVCGDDRIASMVAEVTREDDAQRVIAATLERYGRLDILSPTWRGFFISTSSPMEMAVAGTRYRGVQERPACDSGANR